MKNLLSAINWSDIGFDELIVSTDSIIIELSNDELEQNYKIICVNYIGFASMGHWDENVLSDISIISDTTFIKKCLDCIQSNYSFTDIPGNPRKFNDEWYEVKLSFIDNSHLSIVSVSYTPLTLPTLLRV